MLQITEIIVRLLVRRLAGLTGCICLILRGAGILFKGSDRTAEAYKGVIGYAVYNSVYSLGYVAVISSFISHGNTKSPFLPYGFLNCVHIILGKRTLFNS